MCGCWRAIEREEGVMQREATIEIVCELVHMWGISTIHTHNAHNLICTHGMGEKKRSQLVHMGVH